VFYHHTCLPTTTALPYLLLFRVMTPQRTRAGITTAGHCVIERGAWRRPSRPFLFGGRCAAPCSPQLGTVIPVKQTFGSNNGNRPSPTRLQETSPLLAFEPHGVPAAPTHLAARLPLNIQAHIPSLLPVPCRHAPNLQVYWADRRHILVGGIAITGIAVQTVSRFKLIHALPGCRRWRSATPHPQTPAPLPATTGMLPTQKLAVQAGGHCRVRRLRAVRTSNSTGKDADDRLLAFHTDLLTCDRRRQDTGRLRRWFVATP